MEQFVGQIQAFGFGFAPRGWAFCNGQLLAVSQYDALFSLIGTIYGGDGRTTFGLPDLRGRVSLGMGTGSGLPAYKIGQKGGLENETLSINEMPSHKHTFRVVAEAPNVDKSSGASLATPDPTIYSSANADETLNPTAIANNGGNQSHNNMMPFQTISWCIALVGVYPSRT